MTVTIKKIGGSMAVVIPKEVAREMELTEGTPMQITSTGESIVMAQAAVQATTAAAAGKNSGADQAGGLPPASSVSLAAILQSARKSGEQANVSPGSRRRHRNQLSARRRPRD
jgi:antitoxin component of MazEF toxin-antitoxin module